jgi:drug/metabolite transporter (DMT)-like permease
MKNLLLFIFIAATGNTLYHIGQKTLPLAANPMVLLMGVYALAFLLAAISVPLFQSSPQMSLSTQVFNWPVIILGVGAFLIEFGFLFLYRTGGSLQWSGTIVGGLTALLLIPVAIFCYGESYSGAHLLGILLILTGISLLVQK